MAGVWGRIMGRTAPRPPAGEGGRIRAYHASPHRFERFEISPRTVGTGEGYSGYGYGAYFADSDAGVEPYRRIFTTVRLPDGGEVRSSAAQTLSAAQGDYDVARARLEEQLALDRDLRGADSEQVRTLESDIAELDELERAGATLDRGSTYEVDLHIDPGRLVDYGKTLSEQPPAVRSALQTLYREIGVPWDQVEALTMRQALDGAGGAPSLERAFGDPSQLSRRLRDLGVDGAVASAVMDPGRRQFVVFDDQTIEIIRRYGIVGALGLGGAAALSGTEEAEASPVSRAVRGMRPWAPRPSLREAARAPDPLGFRSTLFTALADEPMNQGVPNAWRNRFRRYGVTADELRVSGIEDIFAEAGENAVIPREALLENARRVELREVRRGSPLSGDEARALEARDLEINRELRDLQRQGVGSSEQARRLRSEQATIRGRQGATFDTYTVPGGENYREIALAVDEPIIGADFEGAHFGGSGVVAHMRTTDRVINGKRTLYVEEVQSDLFQRARDEGFADDPVVPGSREALQARWDALARDIAARFELSEAQARRRLRTLQLGNYASDIPDDFFADPMVRDAMSLGRQMDTIPNNPHRGPRPPRAPFEQSWPEMVLRRAIRIASEEGYDAIAIASPEAARIAQRHTEVKEGIRAFYGERLPRSLRRIARDLGLETESGALTYSPRVRSEDPAVLAHAARQREEAPVTVLSLTPEARASVNEQGWRMFSILGVGAAGTIAALSGTEEAEAGPIRPPRRVRIGPLREAAAERAGATTERIDDTFYASRPDPDLDEVGAYVETIRTEYDGRPALQVSRAESDEGPGSGLGAPAYLATLEQAAREGVDLVSDGSVSPSARRVWEALERRGIPVERNPDAVAGPDVVFGQEGESLSSDSGWVFRIRKEHIAPAAALIAGGGLALSGTEEAEASPVSRAVRGMRPWARQVQPAIDAEGTRTYAFHVGGGRVRGQLWIDEDPGYGGTRLVSWGWEGQSGTFGRRTDLTYREAVETWARVLALLERDIEETGRSNYQFSGLTDEHARLQEALIREGDLLPGFTFYKAYSASAPENPVFVLRRTGERKPFAEEAGLAPGAVVEEITRNPNRHAAAANTAAAVAALGGAGAAGVLSPSPAKAAEPEAEEIRVTPNRVLPSPPRRTRLTRGVSQPQPFLDRPADTSGIEGGFIGAAGRLVADLTGPLVPSGLDFFTRQYADNATQRAYAFGFDQQNAEIEALTGEVPPDPYPATGFKDGVLTLGFVPGTAFSKLITPLAERAGVETPQQTVERLLAERQAWLEERGLGEQFTVEDAWERGAARMLEAEEEFAAVYAAHAQAGGSAGTRLAAAVIAGLAAAPQDPLQATTFAVPIGGTGRNALLSVGRVASANAVISAGTEAMLQPGVQATREALGLPREDERQAILWAALGGFIAGGALEAPGALGRAVAARATPAERETLIAAARAELEAKREAGTATPEERAVLDVVEAVERFDDAAPQGRADEAQTAMLDALRAAERAGRLDDWPEGRLVLEALEMDAASKPDGMTYPAFHQELDAAARAEAPLPGEAKAVGETGSPLPRRPREEGVDPLDDLDSLLETFEAQRQARLEELRTGQAAQARRARARERFGLSRPAAPSAGSVQERVRVDLAAVRHELAELNAGIVRGRRVTDEVRAEQMRLRDDIARLEDEARRAGVDPDEIEPAPRLASQVTEPAAERPATEAAAAAPERDDIPLDAPPVARDEPGEDMVPVVTGVTERGDLVTELRPLSEALEDVDAEASSLTLLRNCVLGGATDVVV